MSPENLELGNCTKDISGCRVQMLGNTSLMECHEKAVCQWSASFGHLKFCEHPSARLAVQST